ncbi:hypothetical protein ACW0FV_004466 [Vibrio parahaemolyticus]|nr:hypothetical protein [Vibrio parahaemolyticus]HCH1023300.1 hypothetical protein [Vibrio parahaemolyticus]
MNLGIGVYGGKLEFGGSALLPLNAALALGWNQRSKVLMFIGFFFQLYT